MKLLFRIVAASLAGMLVYAAAPKQEWSDQGVLFLDRSWNARVHTVPITAVHMRDGFWTSRRKAVTERSLPLMLQMLEEHGAVDNFRRVSGRKNVARRGGPGTDAEVYKWIEAASWAIASNETSDNDKQKFRLEIQSVAGDIMAAQDPSGYLDTYFTGPRASLRYTDPLHSMESYCLGNFIQAGIAYYRATGSRRLLDPAIRAADQLLSDFGPSKRPFATGFPELEMALVELYRTTRDTKYLDFTRYLFSGAEQTRLKVNDATANFMFSGKAFTSHSTFEGQPMRALNAASGAADYLMEAGDPAYKHTLDAMWADLVAHKMYITGAVGSQFTPEDSGGSYQLPNDVNYGEACAAVSNLQWNFRLLMLTGDASYADVFERALYNAANSGISISGTQFSYRTPLVSRGAKLRSIWFERDCAPTDLGPLFEALPAYIYGVSRDGLYVNLYESSDINWHLADGRPVRLTQTTDYPWNGDNHCILSLPHPTDFTVFVRWPSWASTAQISVNGRPWSLSGRTPGSFVPITRHWRDGDVIDLSFPMPVVPTTANPEILENYARLALQRGPLVYALEQADQGTSPLFDLFLRKPANGVPEPHPELLGGVTVLKVQGQAVEKPLTMEPLYQPATVSGSRASRSVSLRFIPYYSVGNRDAGAMEVWVPIAGVY
jgi:uncharacterized protein